MQRTPEFTSPQRRSFRNSVGTWLVLYFWVSTWDLKLEGLCLAVCYLFKKLKPVFASLEFQKRGYTFVIRLYLGTETVSCWLWMARMDMHRNLTKLSQHFQVITYGMPSKITKENIVVSAPCWWNLFDIFVITVLYRGILCLDKEIIIRFQETAHLPLP